jgi:hypothetical protein
MKAIASSKLPKLRRTLISPSQMTQNRLCVAAGPSIGMSVLFISLSPRFPSARNCRRSFLGADSIRFGGALRDRSALGDGRRLENQIDTAVAAPRAHHPLAQPASGIFRPRVQTSVPRLNSA